MTNEMALRTSDHLDRDRRTFSDLLDLADSIQMRIERLDQRMIVMFSGLLAFFILFFAILILLKNYIDSNELIFTVTIFMIAIPVVGYFSLKISTLKKSYQRERRAFEETMGIIHEVFTSISENLTPLEVAEFKIRLSRLDN